MRIDSHQHFWHFDPVRDNWITGDMSVIRRGFLPEDLQPLLVAQGMDGCVAVQASQSEEETLFLLDLASHYPFIKGVVGWVDLRAGDVHERLGYFSTFPLLKGFRHIVQAEQDDFLLRRDFCRGISLLQPFGFTYDILIFPRHLPYAFDFVRQFPAQPFVIDHLAKPLIRQQEWRSWKSGIEAIAQFPNVYCKLSGMVTEADWRQWEPGDFRLYIDTIVQAFGPERIMFGSDWPVCLLAADYAGVCGLLEQHTANMSGHDKARLWGLNAAAFYNL